MILPKIAIAALAVALCTLAGGALADTGSADQQEVWKVEQQQWKMSAAKDDSWIEALAHPNLRYWESGAPMPRDRASLRHWSRYENESGTVLEQEIFPISATITGNVAVVRYDYMMARENSKKERETVTGHYQVRAPRLNAAAPHHPQAPSALAGAAANTHRSPAPPAPPAPTTWRASWPHPRQPVHAILPAYQRARRA